MARVTQGGFDARLGIAGRIARYFIDSKLTVLIALLALFAGVMALALTPREENPRIVVPAANILVAKPGASPAEVEELVVKPLEAILQGLQGVEHIYGSAMDSLGVVTVQFYVGEDKEDALVRLYDRIMSNLDHIPPGAQQPLVKPADVDDVPILVISLASNRYNDSELRRIAQDVLAQLRRVEDVSVTFVHGGRPRQIGVHLDLERLRRYGVSLLDIRRVLEAVNVGIPSGTLVQRGTVSTVAAGGMLRSAEDVRRIVVGLRQHRPIYLEDVATITDGPGEIERLHRIAFGPAYAGERPGDIEVGAVALALAKRGGSNAVRVADSVLEELGRVAPELIPPGVLVTVTRNDGERANDAVNTLIEHLGIAIGTVVLLLVLALGWRAAGIVTLTIPLILFITLAVGMIAGQSINRITLFALILALGLLVDDSIVVIENIYRHYARPGVDRARAAVAAVSEIGRPTNLATFTVILAFLPMLWVTGMMGPYMQPIPFNVPVAMLTSLAIAYTVAPWAARRWLKTAPGEAGGAVHEHAPGRMERGYAVLMRPLLGRRLARWAFFLLVGLLLVATLAMPLFGGMLFKMLPKNDTNTFNITLDMPEGTALAETDRVVRRAGDVVRAHPQVTSYESTVGESGVIDFNGMLRGAGFKRGPHVAEVRVNLRDKHARSESSIDVALDLRPPLAQLQAETGANIKVNEDPPGPPVRATLLAELYGPDYDRVRRIAQEVRSEVFARTADVVDIDDSTTADVREYRVVVDRERAELVNVSPAEVARTLQAFLTGLDIGAVHIEEEPEPVAIRVRMPVADRTSPEDLRRIFFVNPLGVRIPLGDIAEIRETVAPKPIERKDRRRVVYVTGELAQTSPVYAVLDMWNYLRRHPLPSGVRPEQYFTGAPDTLAYSLRWDGEMRLTLDVFRDLGAAFAVSVGLIYLILVGYYRSFAIPLIVMGAIPLTIVGVFPGHALFGQYFTATSMIGVIALAGIVVRNSLLLIDFILEFRRAGHGLRAAVVRAGVMRMRPILLTAGAIILATFVIAFDPVFGGLAVALISGTFASTALSLLVIPLLYYSYERRRAPEEQAPGPDAAAPSASAGESGRSGARQGVGDDDAGPRGSH